MSDIKTPIPISGGEISESIIFYESISAVDLVESNIPSQPNVIRTHFTDGDCMKTIETNTNKMTTSLEFGKQYYKQFGRQLPSDIRSKSGWVTFSNWIGSIWKVTTDENTELEYTSNELLGLVAEFAITTDPKDFLNGGQLYFYDDSLFVAIPDITTLLRDTIKPKDTTRIDIWNYWLAVKIAFRPKKSNSMTIGGKPRDCWRLNPDVINRYKMD